MNIISLSPAMNKRLNFKSPVMDIADVHKVSKEDSVKILNRWISLRLKEDRDEAIMGHIWLVKDLVCRFRAHWPETRRFTDDLVSEGLHAMTEFMENLETSINFFETSQQFIHNRMRDFINKNRSTIWASVRTNRRRQEAGEPLEYIFAQQLNEWAFGVEDVEPHYVDILDAIEQLAECDREEMHQLITLFLEREHGIDEASLSDEERKAIDRLSEIGRDLL